MVREYLLAPDHPQGGAKAQALANAGFSADTWEQLAHQFSTDCTRPHRRRIRGTKPLSGYDSARTAWSLAKAASIPAFSSGTRSETADQTMSGSTSKYPWTKWCRMPMIARQGISECRPAPVPLSEIPAEGIQGYDEPSGFIQFSC